MGTRSNVRVYDDESTQVLVTLYRQYDGYPSGMGNDIQEILNDPDIVNGYNPDMEAPAQFNGMGCLAAYLIGQLKENRIGNVYIFPPDHEPGQSWEEYLYDLYKFDGQLYMDVYALEYVDLEDDENFDKKRVAIYTGPLSEYDADKVEKEQAERYKVKYGE